MPFHLRKTVPADLPRITAIYRDAVLHSTASYEITPPGEEEMASRFQAIRDRNYPYITAEDENGTLLGYAYASAFRPRPAYRWMVEDSIYLAEEARGRGLGRLLLSNLVQECEALGFRQMIAVIGGATPASIALHRSIGFAEIGLLKGAGYKHGRWLDTMLMQKTLGDGTDTDPDLAAYPGSLFSA
ncbi:GNAT family N-acetyltransferase [Rhizobium sp. BK602]|uniref:GNAT family N-acetyltransferase n=1 Tax=Rhizobium sp. BK602 TaxID=2586986 RepID=UPI0016229077|nr:GNAT family N-acetyltransferase [Rhizobium sp. BK602]MBB3611871.1 phosphinothricin acetyltransferase [Rhizobium sp. BK602]